MGKMRSHFNAYLSLRIQNQNWKKRKTCNPPSLSPPCYDGIRRNLWATGKGLFFILFGRWNNNGDCRNATVPDQIRWCYFVSNGPSNQRTTRFSCGRIYPRNRHPLPDSWREIDLLHWTLKRGIADQRRPHHPNSFCWRIWSLRLQSGAR